MSRSPAWYPGERLPPGRSGPTEAEVLGERLPDERVEVEARRVLAADGLDLADHDAVVAEEYPRAGGELHGDALVVGVSDAERRPGALRHSELRDRVEVERAPKNVTGRMPSSLRPQDSLLSGRPRSSAVPTTVSPST